MKIRCIKKNLRKNLLESNKFSFYITLLPNDFTQTTIRNKDIKICFATKSQSLMLGINLNLYPVLIIFTNKNQDFIRFWNSIVNLDVFKFIIFYNMKINNLYANNWKLLLYLIKDNIFTKLFILLFFSRLLGQLFLKKKL